MYHNFLKAHVTVTVEGVSELGNVDLTWAPQQATTLNWMLYDLHVLVQSLYFLACRDIDKDIAVDIGVAAGYAPVEPPEDGPLARTAALWTLPNTDRSKKGAV